MAVKLRPLEPEDLDDLYLIENDMSDWGGCVSNVPYSRYSLRNYIATQQCDIYVDKQLRLVVESNGIVAGLVDLQNFDPHNSRAEVGIIIKRSMRRRGLAADALAQIVDYARNVLGIEQLYAIVNVSNKSSVRLFEKLNFIHTSTLQNWIKTSDKSENACVFQLFLKKIE